MSSHPIGLYLHLPFCARICHYCDFAKTALFTTEQKLSYLRALENLVDDYRHVWSEIPGVGSKFFSVFLGGGTPSLFAEELRPLMQKILAVTETQAEITLEANPEHMTAANVAVWKNLGFNRLSLGVQSFDDRGLKALTREHSRDSALEAVELGLKTFGNCNVDLIYGWPGQTEEDWLKDVDQLIASGATHASLYNLTFEGNTPFARRLSRGRMEALDDDRLFTYYSEACRKMSQAGYTHEEVSNWHLSGCEAKHNGLYWHGGSYLGLGSGAHSFLEELGPYGTRFQQNANWRTFVPEQAQSLLGIMTRHYNSIDRDRDAEAFILEVVSSGLRTNRGINIPSIEQKSGYSFVPRAVVQEALRKGLMRWENGEQLFLEELEWFRETRWSLEVALSFVLPKNR